MFLFIRPNGRDERFTALRELGKCVHSDPMGNLG